MLHILVDQTNRSYAKVTKFAEAERVEVEKHADMQPESLFVCDDEDPLFSSWIRIL